MSFSIFSHFLCLLTGLIGILPARSSTLKTNDAVKNGSNETFSGHAEIDTKFLITIYVTMIISACGFISNGFLLVVFVMDPLKCLRNISSGLILNLCVADFLTAVMLFIWTTTLWDWGSDLLVTVIFCVVWFGYSASFLTIALLALERYIVIRYNWSSDTLVTKKRTVYGVLVVWLLSGVTFIRLDVKNLHIHMFVFSSVCEICVVVVVTFYIKLWIVRRRHAFQQHRGLVKQELKLTKVVFALIVVLVLTTLPLTFLYQLLHGLVLFCGKECISEVIPYLPTYFTPVFALNFTLNPLIYGWRLPKYRRSFGALWSIIRRNPVLQKRKRFAMSKLGKDISSLDVSPTQVTNGSCTSL